MILPLRQRHRRMVTVLGVFLPVVFAAGLAARKPVPVMPVLPPALVVQTPHFTSVEWERDGLFAKSRMLVRLLREQKGAGRFAVEFAAAKDFVKPDLIVYWVAGSAARDSALPSNAVVLGSFIPGVPLSLPVGAESGGGALVLYSLAGQEVVAISQHFTPPKP